MADLITFESEEQHTFVLQSEHIISDSLTIPNVTTLPELFRFQAHQRQDAALFSFRNPEDNTLTTISYIDAYNKTYQLAQNLQIFHRSSNDRAPVVGIWLEKSLDLHLAILATTISGATWLPFDADAPATRVATCIEDSDACILLCDAAHYEAAARATDGLQGCSVVTFDGLSSYVPGTINLTGPRPSDSAYMIYTSGSTGTPKGIEIPHSAALAFCLSERSCLETSTTDVVWQGFSAAFDMFIEEVWVSIAGGAHLVIGNRSECQDVPSLGGASGIWAQRGITLVNAVPTLINIMTSLDSECPLPPSVRLLNLGGEACPLSLVNRLWSPSLRILNTYGPSETTVTATFQELFPHEPVTIGKPLPLYHALLLTLQDGSDKSWAPAPIALKEGAEGELAIGGPCLGKGYVQRPELTNEKFIPHPLPTIDGEKLYRTGDLVRLDNKLNIVFLGRIDTQVKHRGFRIELGEIEHAIASHARVQTAAVILSTCTDRLEAYVVGQGSENIDPRELRDTLRHLPAYMQPEEFFFISADEMPRLPSGKINAKALQLTSVNNFASSQTEQTSSSASIQTLSTRTLTDNSDLGVILRAMVETFPKSARITSDSDFFDDLGGHSLIAAQLVSKLRKESLEGSPLKSIGLQAIYQHRTAAAIVASFGGSSDPEKGTGDNVEMGDHWDVSQWNYVCCGIAQIPALFFFFLIESITIFVPYLVFYFVLIDSGITYAIFLTYAAFVVIPIMRVVVGIAGKWITLGKAKEGEYPVYGVYYYRWWLAERFANLVDMISIAKTPLLPALMRLMGARVGQHCHLGVNFSGPAFDLVTIGDDVVFGADVVLATSWVERGRLILAPVTIGSDVHVGSSTVIEGFTTIEDGGELGPMSMLPQDSCIPAGEKWTGSPAQYHSLPKDVGNMRTSRPSQARVLVMILAMTFSSTCILPIIYYAPQIPSMLLFDYVDIPGVGEYAQMAIVCVPAAIIYMLLVFIELIALKWIVLGKVEECSYRTISVYFYRKWLVDRLMDISLSVLQPVYATLYVVPFLRCLGVKIGKGAEVSTARGISFELTEIGDQSFIADRVLLGDDVTRNNIVTQRRTRLHKRAFLGNGAMVPQGIELASNTLVGVLSIAPETPLKEGQSCFGSPAVIMPARQRSEINHSEDVLFSPTKRLRALRLAVEGLRIFVPRILVVFGLGFSMQIFESGYKYYGAWPMLLLLPIFYLCFFALPSILIPCLLKWTLIGRYHNAEWPLWSLDVWKSEFVTSAYETLSPFCADLIIGTPFMAMVFRLFGVQVGHRTVLLSSGITEFDMVSIGDEAVLNRHAGPQTHLFEDRIMKVGRIDLERRACMKAFAVALPGSRIGACGQLGAKSLVMKGETVPSGQAWEGAPIAPRRARKSSKIVISEKSEIVVSEK